MTSAQLVAEAEKVVAATLRRLPPEVQTQAARLPVCFYDRPSPAMLGDSFEEDILGLFVGDHHGVEAGATNTLPPQILLFLDNIFDEAESDLSKFREEVRITFLHELGHYLGWDEDDLEFRGL